MIEKKRSHRRREIARGKLPHQLADLDHRLGPVTDLKLAHHIMDVDLDVLSLTRRSDAITLLAFPLRNA